jgi:hypothetical protein
MNDKTPLESKKFWAFLVTDFALVVAMIAATYLKTPPEIAAYVLSGIVVTGLGIVFGQGGIDVVKAYMTLKTGKQEP